MWWCHECAGHFETLDFTSDVPPCTMCGGAFVEFMPHAVTWQGDEEEDEYDEYDEENDEEYDDDDVYHEDGVNTDASGSPDSGGGTLSPQAAGGASEEILDSLPAMFMTAKDVEAEPECAICNEDFNAGECVLELGCKHHYHRHCAVDWLARQSSCPVCRWELPRVPPSVRSLPTTTSSQPAFTAAAVASAAAAAAASVAVTGPPRHTGSVVPGASSSSASLTLQPPPPPPTVLVAGPQDAYRPAAPQPPSALALGAVSPRLHSPRCSSGSAASGATGPSPPAQALFSCLGRGGGRADAGGGGSSSGGVSGRSGGRSLEAKAAILRNELDLRGAPVEVAKLAAPMLGVHVDEYAGISTHALLDRCLDALATPRSGGAFSSAASLARTGAIQHLFLSATSNPSLHPVARNPPPAQGDPGPMPRVVDASNAAASSPHTARLSQPRRTASASAPFKAGASDAATASALQPPRRALSLSSVLGSPRRHNLFGLSSPQLHSSSAAGALGAPGSSGATAADDDDKEDGAPGRTGLFSRLFRQSIGGSRRVSGGARLQRSSQAEVGADADGHAAACGLHQIMLEPTQVLTLPGGARGFYAYAEPSPLPPPPAPPPPAPSPSASTVQPPAPASPSASTRALGTSTSSSASSSPASAAMPMPNTTLTPRPPSEAALATALASEAVSGAGGAGAADGRAAVSRAGRGVETTEARAVMGARGEGLELIWIPAAAVTPTHLSRKVLVAYRAERSAGRVLYSRDVPINQEAAARAYRGLVLAAKKSFIRQHQGQPGHGQAGQPSRDRDRDRDRDVIRLRALERSCSLLDTDSYTGAAATGTGGSAPPTARAPANPPGGSATPPAHAARGACRCATNIASFRQSGIPSHSPVGGPSASRGGRGAAAAAAAGWMTEDGSVEL